MKLLHFFAAVMLSNLILLGSEVHACSCVPPSPPRQEFEDSDAVLMGTVTSFELVGEYRRLAEITLLKLWKGEKERADEILTGLNSAMCGFHFVVGETYVIYAFADDDGKLLTSICTRTTRLDNAAEDLTFLDEIDPIFSAEDSRCCGGPVSGGDALIVAGVLLFLLIGQRQKSDS